MILQTLKDTFAEKLPAEIEKIKKLRKCVDTPPSFLAAARADGMDPETTARQSLVRLP